MDDEKVLQLIGESMEVMSAVMAYALAKVLEKEVGEASAKRLFDQLTQEMEEADLHTPMKELYLRYRN